MKSQLKLIRTIGTVPLAMAGTVTEIKILGIADTYNFVDLEIRNYLALFGFIFHLGPKVFYGLIKH